MGVIVFDQQTINRVTHQRNKDLYKVNVFKLKNEIKKKENAKQKLKIINRIIFISAMMLTIIMFLAI